MKDHKVREKWDGFIEMEKLNFLVRMFCINLKREYIFIVYVFFLKCLLKSLQKNVFYIIIFLFSTVNHVASIA